VVVQKRVKRWVKVGHAGSGGRWRVKGTRRWIVHSDEFMSIVD